MEGEIPFLFFPLSSNTPWLQNHDPSPSGSKMVMSDAEIARLSHADYWDERYSETDPGQQYHEWFRSFDDLMPFFEQNLLKKPASNLKILHLGSGDSVSRLTCLRPSALRSAPSSIPLMAL